MTSQNMFLVITKGDRGPPVPLVVHHKHIGFVTPLILGFSIERIKWCKRDLTLLTYCPVNTKRCCRRFQTQTEVKTAHNVKLILFSLLMAGGVKVRRLVRPPVVTEVSGEQEQENTSRRVK